MAFKFSLENILKYRGQLEKEAQANFGRIESERLNEEARGKEIANLLLSEQNKLDNLPLNQQDHRFMMENFIRGLREDLVKSQRYSQSLQKKADEARQILTEKAKEKKVLEKLKEKEESKYVQQEKYEEQKFFDEITTGRGSRESYSD